MNPHKLAVKIFAQDAPALAADTFIPVFHSWIQQNVLTDHMLIDVADYAHVPDGPGTVLVSLEANLSTDRAKGRLGLLYVRKQPVKGADTFAARLRAVFGSTLEACAKMEEEPNLRGKLKFRTDELSFRIYDRLLAPNNAATFERVKPELQKFLTELFGGAYVTLERNEAADDLFEVRVKAPTSESVAVLRQRLTTTATR